MKKPVIFMGCLAVALSGVSAWGAEFILQPVRASGTNTIVGAEIRLSGGGQRVFLEVKLKSFAPSVLKTYQATLNSAGYTSGSVGTLAPALESCPSADATGNTVCQTAFGEAGGTSSCRDVDPGPGTVLRCEPAWINGTRTDRILAANSPLYAPDLSSPDYRWGGTAFSGQQVDNGLTYYGGSLVLDVPANAVGTFTIAFISGPDFSVMADENNTPINPLLLTPAKITVLCINNAQCVDTNACTADSCDAQGVCVNTPNYNQATQCCDPDDPNLPTRLETISDGNECTTDSCNPDTGDVGHMITAGANCGPPGQTISQCNLQDTCDANGFCQANILPSGSSCGSTTHSDCNFADTCNDAGTCLENIQPAGTMCGSQATGPCDAANTCNANGNCLENYAPNNSVCNDLLFCTDNTLCNSTGVCGGGTPHRCSDSLTCTTDTCIEDQPPGQGHCENDLNSGFCLIAGACYADGDLEPGFTCFECDPSANISDWTQLANGTQCKDGNACTGTGREGIDPDACTNGVCAGELDPQCNDQCEFAVPAIVGQNLSTNESAGDDGGVASCQIDTHADVWFVFTADCDGAVFISTTGSDLQPVNDPVLNVYTECPLDSGVEIACDDDSGVELNAALTFATVQGEDYFIRVSGFGNNKGLVIMNLRPSGDCLIAGACYTAYPLAGSRNPENDCLACVPQISTTDWSLVPEGDACGDPTDTECSSPDACDGAGLCELNHKIDGIECSDEGDECTKNQCAAGECAHPFEPAGLLCGDRTTDTDCDNPDTCDGGGDCLDNLEGPGFACGDPSQSQCDLSDFCNGLGTCLTRHVPNGVSCNDGDICTEVDQCDTGVCVGEAILEAPLVEAISGRHLRVTPQPALSVAPVALRVTSPTWPCLLQWIDANGNLVGIADRVFMTPADWGTALVEDPDVVPSSTYEVVAECGTLESAAGSDQTYRWGDVNNDGFADFTDIALIVSAYRGTFILPIQAYDLHPCTPNGIIDFRDIANDVSAYKGLPFPCSLPCHD